MARSEELQGDKELHLAAKNGDVPRTVQALGKYTAAIASLGCGFDFYTCLVGKHNRVQLSHMKELFVPPCRLVDHNAAYDVRSGLASCYTKMAHAAWLLYVDDACAR